MVSQPETRRPTRRARRDAPHHRSVARPRRLSHPGGRLPALDAATLLTRFAGVIDAHDWDGLADLLHTDFSCRLVHTGELFDRAQWIRLNADYPGFQRLLVDDLVSAADRAVLRATVTGTSPEGEDQAFAVASFATVRDDLIVELTEVWTDLDQQAPDGTRPQPLP